MKVLCALSGIEFSCDYFPGTLSSREHYHPIFSMPQKALLSYGFKKWESGELTDTDSYLLYLALFNSTDLVEFRVPTLRTPKTSQIVASHMEALAEIVHTINVIGYEKCSTVLSMPSFVISPDTKNLECTGNWIKIWEANYADYLTGYKLTTSVEYLSRKENKLERLIRSKADIATYAGTLAEWANTVAEFPTDIDWNENDQDETFSSYWRRIIRKAAKGEQIFCIPRKDLNDLVSYCEENIPHGSLCAHTLMTLLREAQDRKNAYLDLGDVDLSTGETAFRILDAESSIEDANKIALIDSAPTEFPLAENYPSKLAFLRAKLKYSMAQEYKKQLEANTPVPQNPSEE